MLSPRSFCGVLQAALSVWRRSAEAVGFDVGDGLPTLLDLKFADDLLLFSQSLQDATQLLDELARRCSSVGLRLDAAKTKVLTTQASHPLSSSPPIIDILPSNDAHRWLGCLLSCHGSKATSADVDFHLQVAAKAFFANKDVLCDYNISLTKRLHFFDTVITPVAYFAPGHRAVFQADSRQYDVTFEGFYVELWVPLLMCNGICLGMKYCIIGI